MDLSEIYKNLDFLDDFLRTQYTNFIYKYFSRIENHISIEEVYLRLKNDEPIEYIFNIAIFQNNEFYVDKRVLIPRPETEKIIDIVLEFLKNHELDNTTIIDIGTGSGCIALSLAKKLGHKLDTIQIIGIDISQDALDIALLNRKQLVLDDKVEFKNVDFRHFDFSKYENLIIVANLPYIPLKRELQKSVIEYEPHLALFGGTKGDELINDLKGVAENLGNLKLLVTEEDHGEIKKFEY